MFVIPSITSPQAFRVSRDPADNRVKLQMQARGYENKWAAIDRCVWNRFFTGSYRTCGVTFAADSVLKKKQNVPFEHPCRS